jgi:hypothetical protein
VRKENYLSCESVTMRGVELRPLTHPSDNDDRIIGLSVKSPLKENHVRGVNEK